MEVTETGRMKNFRFWCQKVLPAVYDDSLSYYELLCKVVDYLNTVINKVNGHSDAIAELENDVDALQDEFKKFKESGFDDYYAAQIEKWVKDNVGILFSTFCKSVTFGLTSDGYFCAYVPESWSDIVFDTGMVYGRSTYGRLLLKYDVDGTGVIDNTYSYDGQQETRLDQVERDIKSFGADVEKGKVAYSTLYTDLDKEVD